MVIEQADGDTVKAHAEVICQVAEEFKILLDPVQPEWRREGGPEETTKEGKE